jgi:hypothetical protein
MRIAQRRDVAPEKVREMILTGYRVSFKDPAAASNRAKYVAERLGIQVRKLYEQIRELDLKGEIGRIRERAGVSSSGRSEGAHYRCSACGVEGHNARSPKCKYYEAP